jgi:hypothetical protein
MTDAPPPLPGPPCRCCRGRRTILLHDQRNGAPFYACLTCDMVMNPFRKERFGPGRPG